MFDKIIEDILEVKKTFLEKIEDDIKAIGKARMHIGEERRSFDIAVKNVVMSNMTDVIDERIEHGGEVIGVIMSKMCKAMLPFLTSIANGFKSDHK